MSITKPLKSCPANFLCISTGILLFLVSLLLTFCTEKSYFETESKNILARVEAPSFQKKEFNVQDFGAVADGKKDNHSVVAEAVKTCNEEGGGKVVFSPGKYLINGPIHLLDNVCLDIRSGAEIVFGTNFSDYLPVVKTRWEGTIIYGYSPLIYAYQKKNIGITGEGTINGQGADSWSKWKSEQRQDQLLSRKMNHENTPLNERQFGEGHKLRPSFIQFYECENILVDGVKIIDSPFWCIHPVFSKNITITNVKFDAQNANNDGIDVDSSEDVYISNIDFDNRDDNIAIKSGRDREARELNRPSRNIVIRNCRWKGHNAMAMGSEMSGGIYNVFAQDCSYRGEVRAGIYLKSNRDRGGEISNVHVQNFEFNDCNNAIFMNTNYKNEGEGHVPTFSNIFIEGLTCNSAKGGIIIKGTPEKPIRNVHLKDITIESADVPSNLINTENISFENILINGELIEVPETE